MRVFFKTTRLILSTNNSKLFVIYMGSTHSQVHIKMRNGVQGHTHFKSMKCNVDSLMLSRGSKPDTPDSGWSVCVGKALSSLSVPSAAPCWSSHVTSSVDKTNRTKHVISACQKQRPSKNLKYFRNWDYFRDTFSNILYKLLKF